MRLIAVVLLTAAPLSAQAQIVTTEVDGSRTLVVEALVPAPPAAVWRSVSTAEGWKSWAVPAAWLTGDILETAYDPAARPGGAGNIQQRFLERVPGHSLVFHTIKAPAGFPHAQAFMGVTHFLQLLPEAGGTRVRLTDRGYPAGAEGDELLGFFKTGNQQTIDHLAAHHALAPLDFLVGHCWRGSRAGDGVDTHCFKADGDVIRDHHEVMSGGKKVYQGDTVYRWDATAQAVRYAYTSPAGSMNGMVHAMPGGLDFGIATFEPAQPRDEQGRPPLEIRTRWMRVGATGYDVFDEILARSMTTDPVRYTRVD